MEMKRNPLAGTGKVYKFTLKQLLAAKGWLITTILIAVLLLAGIPLLLWGVAAASSEDKNDTDSDGPSVKTVFVCDETEGKVDYSLLKEYDYKNADYRAFDSVDAALAAVTDADSTLVLNVTKSDGGFLLTAILPDDTALSRGDASSFADFVSSNFRMILLEKANLTPDGAALLSVPIGSSVSEMKADASSADDDEDGLKMVFRFLVPFLMVMLMYMMTILYGQSMANSVMLEKTSKLMETILTAVHPFALMTGKLLATATAAVLQILIWLGSLIIGLFGGAFFAMRMVPETTDSTVQMIDTIANSSGSIFSISGILLSLLVLAVGFLLFLCLGAISGALATKAEDLGKTNLVFTLVIVACFFLCIAFPSAETAATQKSMVSDAVWLRFFPFTAVFVEPSRLILGDDGVLAALGTIVCMVIGTAVMIWVASTIYKGLVLYRGTPPTPKMLLRIIRENRGKKDSTPEA